MKRSRMLGAALAASAIGMMSNLWAQPPPAAGGGQADHVAALKQSMRRRAGSTRGSALVYDRDSAPTGDLI